MTEPRPILAPGPSADPIRVGERDPVPLTLLTGFLGAGKTTLLNRILVGDHGLRVGVLVNDFGAINIDAALIERVEANTISLTNGCVCCEIRDDLVTSVEELLTRSDAVDYVILEASGVADPAGIVMTFLDARYRRLLRIDSITCVIDAEGVFRDADDEQLTALKLRQIAFADLVLLNKADLVARDHLDVIRDWIELHIKRIRTIETSYGDAPLDVLLGAGRFDEVRADGGALDARTPSPAGPAVRFERWSYRSDEPLSRERLEEMVKRELPASVYRCKGIIRTSDSPDAPLLLQVVGRRTNLTEWDGRRPADASTQIVAIGRHLDRALLTELFDGCRERG